MQSLLLLIRRALCAANGVILVDDRFDIHARRFLRSPFRSFCVGALSGAMLGSVGALLAPEMAIGLTVMFAVYFGSLGAALAGSSRWEESTASAGCARLQYGPHVKRNLRRARLAIAAAATGVCFAVAFLSQRPFVVFMLSASFLLLLIAAIGVVALVVELVGAARMLIRRRG